MFIKKLTQFTIDDYFHEKIEKTLDFDSMELFA